MLARLRAVDYVGAMFERLLRPHTDVVFTIFRVFVGADFAMHGLQKVFGVLGKTAVPFGTQAWVGGVLEIVCGLLIAAGFFTAFAAFIASGEMAVAYTQFHWKGQLGADLLPIVNKGELALVFAFLFLYIAMRGPGRFSLDAKLRPAAVTG